MTDLKAAKFQLKDLFPRNNNIICKVNGNGSNQHLRWQTELVLPHPSQQIVLQEMIQTITERIKRLERLVNELAHQARLWRYYPVVQALQAMRGIRVSLNQPHRFSNFKSDLMLSF